MATRTWLRGIPVDRLDVRRLFQLIDEFVASGTPHRICYLNAHCFNLARRDEVYREVLRHSDVVYADGKGIVWACSWFARPVGRRVNLGDFLPLLCDRSRERGYRLYLLGGAPGVARRAAETLRQAHPGLDIVGFHHGYFVTDDEAQILEEIVKAKPDLLLVGLGAPNQEKWLNEHQKRLSVAVCWGVGALFDYFAGVTPRAPRAMRRIGLEWIFRLYHEPKRLWRRYVVGIPRFIFSVGQDSLWDGLLVAAAWAVGRASLGGSAGGVGKVIPLVMGGLLVALSWMAVTLSLGLYRSWSRMSSKNAMAAGLAGATIAVLVGVLVSYLLSSQLFFPAFVGTTVALLVCSRLLALKGMRRAAADVHSHDSGRKRR